MAVAIHVHSRTEPSPSTLPSPATIQPTKGSLDAPVTIVDFSDFQCGHCAHFAFTTKRQIEEEYVETGQVKLVFRNFVVMGSASQLAAEAGECAHQQGHFWEYHDRLFQNLTEGRRISKDELTRLAGELGLDTTAFNLCLDSGKYKDEVERDAQEGKRRGVSGTPTFFINDRRIVGAQPFETFKRIIDDELL